MPKAFAERGATGNCVLGVPAEGRADFLQHTGIGQLVLLFEPERGPLGVIQSARVGDRGACCPVEDLALAARDRLLLGGVVDLFKDARNRK